MYNQKSKRMIYIQIPEISRLISRQKNIRHLSWMKRFDSRVSACITELGDETPAKLSQSYTTLT